jgi:hypothetical protein
LNLTAFKTWDFIVSHHIIWPYLFTNVAIPVKQLELLLFNSSMKSSDTSISWFQFQTQWNINDSAVLIAVYLTTNHMNRRETWQIFEWWWAQQYIHNAINDEPWNRWITDFLQDPMMGKPGKRKIQTTEYIQRIAWWKRFDFWWWLNPYSLLSQRVMSCPKYASRSYHTCPTPYRRRVWFWFIAFYCIIPVPATYPVPVRSKLRNLWILPVICNYVHLIRYFLWSVSKFTSWCMISDVGDGSPYPVMMSYAICCI